MSEQQTEKLVFRLPEKNARILRLNTYILAGLAVLMAFLPMFVPDNILSRLVSKHLGFVAHFIAFWPSQIRSLQTFCEASTLPYEVVLFTLGVHCWIHFWFIFQLTYYNVVRYNDDGSVCLLTTHMSECKDGFFAKLEKVNPGSKKMIKWSTLFTNGVFAYLAYDTYFKVRSVEDWLHIRDAGDLYFEHFQNFGRAIDKLTVKALNSEQIFGIWGSLSFEVILPIVYVLTCSVIVTTGMLFSKPKNDG